MAKLSVSVDVPLSPEQAWDAASDLSRFSEWLSIHKMWRSALPETVGEGTELDSVVEVKGMLNRVHWTIVSYQPPESMTLNISGVGGVRIKLTARVAPVAEGACVQLDIHLGGPALFGPIGLVVAAALKSDIRQSLDQFKKVFS
jgi:uncharacterized protein YndB with AHSA1/START domain